MATETIQLTKNDLKEIITSAIAAAKAPNAVEQQKFDADKVRIEQEQKERLALSKSILQEAENKKAAQRICSHEHRNGDSHAVYVQESKGPGYFLCQKNQCKIRPGVAPEGYKGADIFDTALFNRLFQKAANNEIFG